MKFTIFPVFGIIFVFFSMVASAAEIDNGMKALQSGQYPDALKILVPLANSGDDEAQRVVGEMCYNGQGMKRDLNASFKWTEIAAEGGNKVAQYNLGYLYEKGEGAVISRNNALDWYTKAALQGYVAAQHKLGDIYNSSNRDKAIYWYKKAGESGDEEARRKFASLSSGKVRDMEEANRQYEAKKKIEDRQEYLRELNKQAARKAAEEQSLRAYRADTVTKMQNDFSRSLAEMEAGTRGSTVEKDRAKARQLAEFNENISKMEADPNSDLNRDKRDREQKRAESRRAESERAAKHEAKKKVALEADVKRENDKHAQADAEANALKKQKADELKAQQERDKQRADNERRNKELRDDAERKRVAAERIRVAAAEEAERKAEKERKAQAEQWARAQYLQNVTAGTRLVATKCPDGKGNYYATGTRPKIKPEVVGCVDVRYRAYCPGSVNYSEGIAHNFIGMSGCFGDTYDINPKPSCNVDQVRIEVVETRACSN